MTTNTDINELARQSREVAQSEIDIRTISGPVDKFFDRFSPEELLSVLDALEAAQKRIEKADIEISQWVSVVEAAGQDDAAWHKLADRDGELICKLADSMLKIIERAEKAERRIAELEASQPVVSEGWQRIPQLSPRDEFIFRVSNFLCTRRRMADEMIVAGEIYDLLTASALQEGV